MSDPERVAFIRSKFEKLQAVEMEAAALRKYATDLGCHLLSFVRFRILQVKNQKFPLINF